MITFEDFQNVHGADGQQLAIVEESLKANLRLKALIKEAG